MSEIDRILDELERDHTGDTWHGSPVTHVLRGVTAAQASARPIPHGHTIWELVLHMTAWKNEVRRRIGGELVQLGLDVVGALRLVGHGSAP